MILSQHLLLGASQNSSRVAIRYLGKEILYRDFLAAVARLSYLYQHDIGAGARVVFLCRNTPAAITSFVAMTNIRALSIFLDPSLPPEEMETALRELEATHLLISSDLSGLARTLLNQAHLSLPIIEIEKKMGGEYDPSFTPPPDQLPVEEDTVLLLRSKGVLGKPQWVAFTHRQILHSAQALKARYHVSPTDRFYTPLSWAHPFAWVHGMMFPIVAGVTCVVDHGLQGVELLDFLLDSRVTRLIGIPSFFLNLLLVCKNEKRVLPGTRSITVGLGLLSAELRKTFHLLKIHVAQCYGQIENLWTIAMEEIPLAQDGPEGTFVKGFVGKGLPGLKYKVMDAHGDEIEGKEERVGHLAVSGPSVMQGYFGKEKETKLKLRGTWLYTGNIVQLKGEGETLSMLWMGRQEDILWKNGVPLPTMEWESALRQHPSVADAALFVMPNTKKETILMCAVVKRPGVTLTETQILEYLGALHADCTPRAVVFLESIPRDFGNNTHGAQLRGQCAGLGG